MSSSSLSGPSSASGSSQQTITRAQCLDFCQRVRLSRTRGLDKLEVRINGLWNEVVGTDETRSSRAQKTFYITLTRCHNQSTALGLTQLSDEGTKLHRLVPPLLECGFLSQREWHDLQEFAEQVNSMSKLLGEIKSTLFPS